MLYTSKTAAKAPFQRWLQKVPYQKLEKNRQQKKSSGQKRHKGHTVVPVANSDYIKVHKVGQCAVCGLTLEDTEVFQPIFRAELKYAR